MKAKRVLFYVTTVPIGLWVFVTGFILWFLEMPFRLDNVINNLCSRYEHWAFDVPRGTFVNCPWKKTLKQVWSADL